MYRRVRNPYQAGASKPHQNNLEETTMRKPYVVLAAFTIMMLAAGLAGAVTYNYTLAGASPGGLWSALGAGINAAIKAASSTIAPRAMLIR